MIVLLKVLIFILTFTGFILIALSMDLKETYKRIKSKAEKSTKRIEESTSRESLIGKLIDWTETMIQKSNIRLYVGYNSWIHFLICISSAAFAYRWISNYLSMITSIAFTLVVLFMPYVILKIVTDFFARIEKKNSINFLVILKNFIKTGKNDIFEAFENAAEYIPEPIKSYVKIMVYEYNHKVNALSCLDNFKEKLGTPELKLYIDNVKICYVQGGDTIALTDTFIKEISGLDEDDEKEDAEDAVLNYGLYFLVLMNFIILYWMINGAYKKDILDSLWGQVVFIIDMIVTAYIIFMSLRKY